MAHGRIKYVPRWLYYDLVLPPRTNTLDSGVVELEPTVFMNDTIWSWDLEHFTLFVPSALADYGNTATNIEVRLGMSGQSDMNLVNAPLSALAGNQQSQNLLGRFLGRDSMFMHTLKHPYRLPKDGGFSVRARQNDLQWTFFAHGKGVDSGYPYQFVGRSPELDSPDAEVQVFSSDLRNTGIEDVDIYKLGFKHRYGLSSGYDPDPEYMVNPLTGILWMPGEVEIPFRLLAPHTAFAPGLRGEGELNKVQSVQFPDNTKLHRRQSLRVRLRNIDDTNNVFIRMALFGYLEVL